MKNVRTPLVFRYRVTTQITVDLQILHGRMLVINCTRSLVIVGLVPTTKMESLSGEYAIYLIMPELRFYMLYTSGPRASVRTCGHMLFDMLVTFATKFGLKMVQLQRSYFLV
jgi:hypothetical protein